jgi:tetratricopeptide (TPR) repeat protein
MSERSTDELLRQATQAAQQRRFAEAAALVDELLAREPSHLGAHDLGGFVRFFLGEYAVAEAHCRAALGLRPGHPYALKGLGLCLARQGRVDEGIAFLEQAIAGRPDWFDPYWDLAVTLYEARRSAEALAVLERGARAVPAQAQRVAQFAARIRGAGDPTATGG